MIEQEVNKNCDKKFVQISEDNLFRKEKITALDNQKIEYLDAIEFFFLFVCFCFCELDVKMSNADRDSKAKNIIEFDKQNRKSIKSVTMRKNFLVKVTIRFTNCKMLMFSKVSLKSFVYSTIDVSCFPNEKINEVYDKYRIIKCLLHINLTVINNCSFTYVFVCFDDSWIKESLTRNKIFKVLFN